MKKRVLAVVLAAVLLLTGVAMAADNSLISMSYLEGPFHNSLLADAAAVLSSIFQPVYDLFLSGLTADKVESRGPTWQNSASYTAASGSEADLIILSSGSGILWDAGSCGVDSGVLVDITGGNEILAGGNLIIGHRYVADGQTVLKVTSSAATWMAEGVWHSVTNNVPAASRFVDVSETAWYYDAVNVVTERNIFRGISETEFAPSLTTTRGMMAMILWNMEGQPHVEYTDLFNDVPDGKWYSTAIVWAGQQGLVQGTGNGKYSPDDVISRQEMVLMIQHYARYSGYATVPAGNLEGFSDADKIADWALESMQWAVGESIVSGSDGALRPKEGCTRAEMAAIIRNYLNWSDLRS